MSRWTCQEQEKGVFRPDCLTLASYLQDTIKNPGENAKMKRATLLGIITTTFFYACIGFIGYAAFGNKAPGNLISG